MAAILGVLAKAFAFMGIIVLGYTLKKIHVFKPEDFYVLSKIVIRITLPCAIISNFSKISMDMSMLILCVIGIVCNLIYVGIGYGINQKRSGDAKAFDMLNLSGYNIGNFTMPFIQNFLGPVGFAATSLFDAGNSVMCTGLTFALASAAKGEGGRSSVGSMVKTLLSSLPFDCYMIMTVVAMFQIKLPEVVLSFASTAGGANAFLALFMIGIGFEIHADKEKLTEIVKILSIRYSIALAFSLIFYFLAPFSLEVRQTLAIVAFGPVSSVSPAFTGKLHGDVELSSAINSLQIMISVVLLTLALIVVL